MFSAQFPCNKSHDGHIYRCFEYYQNWIICQTGCKQTNIHPSHLLDKICSIYIISRVQFPLQVQERLGYRSVLLLPDLYHLHITVSTVAQPTVIYHHYYNCMTLGHEGSCDRTNWGVWMSGRGFTCCALLHLIHPGGSVSEAWDLWSQDMNTALRKMLPFLSWTSKHLFQDDFILGKYAKGLSHLMRNLF